MRHAAEQAAHLVEDAAEAASEAAALEPKRVDAVSSVDTTAASINAVEHVAPAASDATEPKTEARNPVSHDIHATASAASDQTGTDVPQPGASDGPPSPRDRTDAATAFGEALARAMQANVASTVSFLTSMLEVRSVSDAVRLNTRHLRGQMEMAWAQGRELTELAQRACADSAAVLRSSVGR